MSDSLPQEARRAFSFKLEHVDAKFVDMLMKGRKPHMDRGPGICPWSEGGLLRCDDRCTDYSGCLLDPPENPRP